MNVSNVSAVGAALRNATNDDDVAIFYPNDTKDYLQMGLLLILLAICILLKVCNAPCCKLSTIKVIPSFSASSSKKLPAPPWAKKSGAGEAGDGAIVPAAAAKHFAGKAPVHKFTEIEHVPDHVPPDADSCKGYQMYLRHLHMDITYGVATDMPQYVTPKLDDRKSVYRGWHPPFEVPYPPVVTTPRRVPKKKKHKKVDPKKVKDYGPRPLK